jgi:putative ABC transport system substrate-binding protein
MAQQHIAGLIQSTDVSFNARGDLITALAGHHAIPLVSATGLISYGPEVNTLHRQAGLYAGRILKGEKPPDLSVVLPTKFELVIDLKIAKELGLTVPPALLARADEVIE